MPLLPPTEFDAYAEHYGKALDHGISISGENKDYFAHGRVAWLATRLAQMSATPTRILDFGCGTGGSTPFFLSLLPVHHVLGVDISSKSVELALASYGSERASFKLIQDYEPAGDVDLAFCNGVFHHIPEADRSGALNYVYKALKPDGIFSFWENNPWNVGTHIVMSRIPFDRGAIKISPPHARTLVSRAGFQVLRTDFMFMFPHGLRCFRGLEPVLAALPLGAQYMVLGRKPPRA